MLGIVKQNLCKYHSNLTLAYFQRVIQVGFIPVFSPLRFAFVDYIYKSLSGPQVQQEWQYKLEIRDTLGGLQHDQLCD
jgi:hypothetical protein